MILKSQKKDFFGDPLWPVEPHTELPPTKQEDILIDESDQILLQTFFNQHLKEGNSSFSELDEENSLNDLEQSIISSEQRNACPTFQNFDLNFLEDSTEKDQSKISNINSEFNMKSILDFSEMNFQNIHFPQEDLQYLKFSNQDYPKQTFLQKNKGKCKRIYKTKQSKLFKKSHTSKGSHLKYEKNSKGLLFDYDEYLLFKVKAKMPKRKNFRSKNDNQESIKLEQDYQNEIQNQILNKLSSDREEGVSKYKILNLQQKKYLVTLASKHPITQIAKRFNISINNICRWKKGCERKSGAGRKIINIQLQQGVKQFIRQAMINNISLTRKMIQRKAIELSPDQSFKASKGWFERFYYRNKNLFQQEESEKEKANRPSPIDSLF